MARMEPLPISVSHLCRDSRVSLGALPVAGAGVDNRRKGVYTRSMTTESALPQRSQLMHMAATCACLNVRRAARAITQLYDEALAPSGVRITQFRLLIAIAVSGSAMLTDLARAVGMD